MKTDWLNFEGLEQCVDTRADLIRARFENWANGGSGIYTSLIY